MRERVCPTLRRPTPALGKKPPAAPKSRCACPTLRFEYGGVLPN